MAVLVRLTNGEVELNDLDATQFEKLLRHAQAVGQNIQIGNGSGESVVIVPEHVVYFTDKAAATANGPSANGARSLRAAEPVPPHQ